ncbi:hypothetical protein K461DRAFT_293764 [Myriangium duriaei CBS 260.36]|uniref:F-box domain-containing protein n=1 Tax=Myriangium duriaei CBS 260.36 TaxID=1168546 RepID=A0A9P4J5D5_9PEZI|nr:hypothetical protein K461DRAFT_293764 [Myriangium duriaei CBS 260.36]
MCKRLEDLPDEVLISVFKKLRPQHLKRVCLTCKHFNRVAKEVMFSSITVLSFLGSQARFRAVAASPHIAAFVREIRFGHYLVHNPNLIWDRAADPSSHLRRFQDLLPHLNKNNFPKLDAVSVAFWRCEAEDIDVEIFCHDSLMAMLNGLYARRIQLDKLTIKNLHNIQDDDLTSSTAFQFTLSELRQLHLHISGCGMHDEGNWFNGESRLITFWPHLRTKWLEPTSSHLTSLSVCKSFHWGVLPICFDLAGLQFPYLRSLTLGFYTIGHNDQLNWVLAQKTLRKLKLQDCSIMRTLIISVKHLNEWPVSTHDWIDCTLPEHADETDSEDNVAALLYLGCWQTFFRRLRTELDLTSFALVFSAETNRPPSSEILDCRRYSDYEADHATGNYRVSFVKNVRDVEDSPDSVWNGFFGSVCPAAHSRGAYEKDLEEYDELMASVGRNAHWDYGRR